MIAGTQTHRLADVFPMLVAEIADLLHQAYPDDPLTRSINDLPYFGPCTCTPTCGNLLTAPPNSGGSYLVELERDGDIAFWLSLDPSATRITAIEILDGRNYGPECAYPALDRQ